MPYKTKGNRLVNEVTLGDGYPLSSNLKPLKVGGKTSPLEMSTAYPDNSVKAKVKVVGDLEVTGTTNIDTVGPLNSGSITSGFGNIDNGSSTLATGEITSGAVIWKYFPFVTSAQTSARGHYFRDVDDLSSPHEKWDAFDADMDLDYRAFFGFFCVPEDCTLVAWQGLVANTGDTANPTISVYHATPETTTDPTEFSLAG